MGDGGVSVWPYGGTARVRRARTRTTCVLCARRLLCCVPSAVATDVRDCEALGIDFRLHVTFARVEKLKATSYPPRSHLENTPLQSLAQPLHYGARASVFCEPSRRGWKGARARMGPGEAQPPSCRQALGVRQSPSSHLPRAVPIGPRLGLAPCVSRGTVLRECPCGVWSGSRDRRAVSIAMGTRASGVLQSPCCISELGLLPLE